MREGSFWICLYAICWVISLIVLYKRNHRMGISGFIISTYIFYAVFSLILYNNADYGSNYKAMRLFPFIYLFIMLFLSLLPAIRFDGFSISHIVRPNQVILDSFSVVFIIVSLILLPSYLSSIREGLVLLTVDSSGGFDLYADTHSMRGASRSFMDIPFVIFSMFSYIAVLVFFYYLTLPKSNKILLVGLSISMVINLLAPISKGLRTETILMIFAIIAAYILVKKWLPERRNKMIRILGTIFFSIVFLLLAVLTVSRAVGSSIETNSSVVDYVGQANLNFNNYGLDAGGIRYGDRTCRIFKEILLFDNVPNNPAERRIKYSKLFIDDYYFYTFVGDFTIDFGPYIAAILFVLSSLFFVSQTKPRKGELTFSQFLILYLAVLIPLQGGMYLFNFSDGGNYTLIAFAFMVFVCNIVKSRPIDAKL